MDWYKMYHGLPTDARLAVVAHRAGVRRAEALAIWVTLLDRASQARPRGYVMGLDAEELAITLDLEPPVVEKTLTALRAKNMIEDDGAIEEWHEKQTISTARVRAFRARQKEMHDHESDDT